MIRFDFQSYSTVSDHYLYVPMFGIALAAAWGLDRLGSRPPAAIPVAAAVAIVLAALGIRSRLQAWHWRDSVALFEHALAT